MTMHPLLTLTILALVGFGGPALAQGDRGLNGQVEKALARHTGDSGSVQFSGAAPTIGGSKDPIGVQDIEFDYRSRRFTATLVSADDRQSVAGRYVAIQRMPVPRQRIAAGREIEKGDIEWIAVEQSRVAGDMIDQLDDMVGMAAKRDLAPGQPIRARDVVRSVLVPKGAMVTLVYKTPLMTLTAVGRAIDAGSRGDVVAVMNLQSKKTVFATVTGSNTAVITPAGAATASN